MTDKSYRCSGCATNWPMIAAYRTCPSCDMETWSSKAEPSLTHAEARDRASGQTTTDLTSITASSPAHANRVERYMDMGFTEVDAQVMACCKDAKGFYLYHHDIRRQLDNGLTHALALQIYA